jgi:hypothetical protein
MNLVTAPPGTSGAFPVPPLPPLPVAPPPEVAAAGIIAAALGEVAAAIDRLAEAVSDAGQVPG